MGYALSGHPQTSLSAPPNGNRVFEDQNTCEQLHKFNFSALNSFWELGVFFE